MPGSRLSARLKRSRGGSRAGSKAGGAGSRLGSRLGSAGSAGGGSASPPPLPSAIAAEVAQAKASDTDGGGEEKDGGGEGGGEANEGGDGDDDGGSKPGTALSQKMAEKRKKAQQAQSEASATYYNPNQDASLLLFGGAGPPKRSRRKNQHMNKDYKGEDVLSNDLWLFDFKARVWRKVMAIGRPPPPTHGHSATLVPSKKSMFVFGGTADGGVATSSVYQLSMASRQWSWSRVDTMGGSSQTQAIPASIARLMLSGRVKDEHGVPELHVNPGARSHHGATRHPIDPGVIVARQDFAEHFHTLGLRVGHRPAQGPSAPQTRSQRLCSWSS